MKLKRDKCDIWTISRKAYLKGSKRTSGDIDVNIDT